MVAVDRQLSAKLANVSFVCMLLVILIHLPSDDLTPMARFVKVYFPGVILRIAVPAFFALSGFFLAGRCEEAGWYKRAVQQRISTLLVPYLVLNVSYWPLKYFVNSFSPGGAKMTLSILTPFEILGLPFCGGPAVLPLWYVLCLFVFIVLSPILVRGIRHSARAAITAVGCTIGIYVAWCVIGPATGLLRVLGPFFYYNFSLWGLMFFTGGIAIRYWGVPVLMRKQCLLIGTVGLVVALALTYYFKEVSDLISLLPVIAMLIGLYAVVPEKRFPKTLLGNVFAVYVLHQQFLYFFEAGLKCVGGYWCVHTGWGIICEWAVCLAGCLFVAEFIRRKLPRVANLCFGGRG